MPSQSIAYAALPTEAEVMRTEQASKSVENKTTMISSQLDERERSRRIQVLTARLGHVLQIPVEKGQTRPIPMGEHDGFLPALGLWGQERTHVDHPAVLARPRIVLEGHLSYPGGQGVGIVRGGLDVRFEVGAEKGDTPGVGERRREMQESTHVPPVMSKQLDAGPT